MHTAQHSTAHNQIWIRLTHSALVHSIISQKKKKNESSCVVKRTHMNFESSISFVFRLHVAEWWVCVCVWCAFILLIFLHNVHKINFILLYLLVNDDT